MNPLLLQKECLICFGESSVSTVKSSCGCIANVHKECLHEWREHGNENKCIVCGKKDKPYRYGCLHALIHMCWSK